MKVQGLFVSALVAGPGMALLPPAIATSPPPFRGEVEVWIGGDATCALSAARTGMAPGAVTFVVANGSRRGYGVVLSLRPPGASPASALNPDGTLRRGLLVDGLPAALPSGATAAFTPTLGRGRYDLWCTDRGRVRSLLGHAPFTVRVTRRFPLA